MDNSILYQNLCEVKEKLYNLFLNKKIDTNLEINNYDRQYLRILAKLEKANFTNFSNKAKISKPAGTKIIKNFIEKGYVNKINNTQDKREYFLDLSDSVKEYFKKSEEEFTKILDEKFSILTENEIKEFGRITKKILENNEWK